MTTPSARRSSPSRPDVRPLAALLALALASCAVAAAEDPDDTLDYEGAGESLDVDDAALEDAKADGRSELRVRAEGLTLWVVPTLEAREVDGELRFVVRGRASRNLESAFSFVPDDAFGTARVIGRRGFELELGPHETSTLLFGLPILVSVRAPGAPHDGYVLQLRGRARLVPIAESDVVHVGPEITPILFGEQIVHRVRASAPGYEAMRATIGGEMLPVDAAGEGRFWIDARYDTIARAASVDEPSVFVARGERGSAQASALVQLVVARIAVTHLDPYEVWPPEECAPATLACLRALEGPDTEPCGAAFAVTRCSAARAVLAGEAERFAIDLREQLVAWYVVHARDVEAAGGNDLAMAQAAVSASSVREITSEDEDPLGHDLSTTLVLSHPDPVFPGSDRVWIGAYDRATGALLELVDFE